MSSFITVDATQQVFDHVLARPVTISGGEHPGIVHLWWEAPQQNNQLVQVYIDDELYDTTVDSTVRQMWITFDRISSHRIELLAVPADDPEKVLRPQADLLQSWHPSVEDIAAISLLRDEELPVDTQLTVSVDGKMVDRGPMWPNDANRSGYGALFGEGQFGMDAITGPGLGGGELGMGPLGTDGTTWHWRRDDLTEAAHNVVIAAQDRTGQVVTNPSTTDLTIDRLPGPASEVQLDSNFTLSWTA